MNTINHSTKFNSEDNYMYWNEPGWTEMPGVDMSTHCCATLVRSKEEASFNETETSSSGREKLSSAEIIMLRLFPGTAAVLYVRSPTAPRLRSWVGTGQFSRQTSQLPHDEGKKPSAPLSILVLQDKHLCMVKSGNQGPFSRHEALTTLSNRRFEKPDASLIWFSLLISRFIFS